MIIDAHLHLWQIARGDYGWLTPDLPIYRDFTVADAQTEAAGIDGAVLVQAASTTSETQHLLEIARTAPAFIRGVVGWADLAAPDAPAQIEALARDPLLVGLRPMLQDIPDPAWILRPAVAHALDAMAACNLTLDLLIRPIHLPHCLALAQSHPTLPMVIDHAAKPAIATGEFAAWAASIARIAADTGIHCKLSGLITEAGTAGWPAIAPFARRAIELFAPHRLIWGSDWPVLNLAADYQTWLATAQSLVHQHAPAAAPDIFGANATRFYRLPA